MPERHTDILIVGAGTGGCAAAMAAASMGYRVILTEETEEAPQVPNSNRLPMKPRFWIRFDGKRFERQAAILARLYLEGREKALGAARYMARHPDKDPFIRMMQLMDRILGKWSLALYPNLKPGANTSSNLLRGSWIRQFEDPSQVIDMDAEFE